MNDEGRSIAVTPIGCVKSGARDRLDAIDGTPVLDIKPYMREFGPIGEASQAAWATELMRDYYLDDPSA
jgi:hypothetical protein